MIIIAQWISDRGQKYIIAKSLHYMMNLVENELADTVLEGEGGTNSESSTDIDTLSCVKQLVGSC